MSFYLQDFVFLCDFQSYYFTPVGFKKIHYM